MRRKQSIKIQQISVRTAMQEFYTEKKALNLSENTLSTYGLHIDRFIEYGSVLDSDCDLKEIQSES